MVTKSRRKPARSSKQKRSRGNRGTGGAGGSQVRKLALIGAGKLGEALLSGILSSQFVPQSRLFATAAHDPRVKFIREKYDVHSGTDNVEAVKGADLVLICLKPQQISTRSWPRFRMAPSPANGWKKTIRVEPASGKCAKRIRIS